VVFPHEEEAKVHAWECADPGVQFDDQIQKWHTCKSDGKINATNPCSEYVFLDDTSCNLGSHNLEKYYVNGRFDAAKFAYAVSLSAVAMDALINYSSFPTMQIGERTRAYRTLGVGYTALGALLMRMGLPYDSATGRQVAAGITSLMSAAGYAASARMAEKAGAFSRFSDNRTSFKDVMRQHQSANKSLLSAVTQASAANLESQKQDQRVLDDAVCLAQSAQACWNVVCDAQEFRNAQISVLAPTGTISFMMGSQASTGIEPILGLVTLKNLAGGGVLRQVNPWVKEALTKLGIEPEFRRELLARIENTGSLHSQTGRNLSDAEAAVFSTSFADPVTGMSLHWNAHVSMMAICQPFISGAISKTVNLPESATVKDIQDVYFSAWNMGLKCIAVYRDGCKGTQAIGTLPKAKSETTPAEVTTILAEIRGEKKWGEREKTGLIRPSITTEVKISDGTSGTKGYLTIGLNADHQPCELFMTFDKVGGTVQGLMHAWCKSVSFNLQLGMSVTDLARAFMNTRFDPSGATTNPDVRTCASIVDFVAKFLLLTFDPASLEEATGRPMKLNPLGVLGRVKPDSRPESTAPVGEPKATLTGRTCGECGTQLVRIGACEMCTNCSTSTGCGG
jgi:ribonucleoside-diphosphate reductase alpha chain